MCEDIMFQDAGCSSFLETSRWAHQKGACGSAKDTTVSLVVASGPLRDTGRLACGEVGVSPWHGADRAARPRSPARHAATISRNLPPPAPCNLPPFATPPPPPRETVTWPKKLRKYQAPKKFSLGYRPNPKDLPKYLIPGRGCCCPQKKNAKKLIFGGTPYAKMGSAKKIARMKYFLPIFDAVAKFLLIISSKHKQKIRLQRIFRIRSVN